MISNIYLIVLIGMSYVRTQETADLCDESYVDSVFHMYDGIKIRRGENLWTYSLDFKQLKVENQRDWLSKYINNGKKDPEIDGTLVTGLYVAPIDCDPTQDLSDSVKQWINDSDHRVNCSMNKKWDSNLTFVIYKDNSRADDYYLIKRWVNNKSQSISETGFRNNLSISATIAEKFVPNGWGKYLYYQYMALIYVPKDLKLLWILNKNEESALFQNTFNALNWNLYWRKTSFSNEMTYNGFLRFKNGTIYAIGEQQFNKYEEQQVRRGISKLFRLDINKTTLHPEPIEFVTLFGCKDSNSDDWIAYLIILIIFLIFVAVIAVIAGHMFYSTYFAKTTTASHSAEDSAQSSAESAKAKSNETTRSGLNSN